MPKKRLSSEVFYWDAPSRAVHKRDLFPLQMEIAGKSYVIPKWTLEHFKVADFLGPLPTKKVFKIKPMVRFRNFNIQFETNAIFLHYDGKKKELIARFEKIPDEHKELLKYFSEALETGDMVNIDNVLRRVDMPVTPASTQLKELPPTKTFKLKRALFTGSYLLMGAGLFYFTAFSLYNKFTRVEVDSAFVSMPVIPIQSPYQGSIDEMLISNGNIVTKGQPLLTLDTSDSEVLPTSYKLDSAKQQVVLYRALIKEKKGKSSQKSRIRKSKLKAAKAALSAASTTRSLKCNRRFESEIDRRNPQKRNAECNAAVVRMSSAQSRVTSEKEALYAATRQSKNSSASLQVLRAKLKQARLKVKGLKTTPQVNKGRETLFSNASGKVVSVIQDQHHYLKKGQVVAIIQKENSTPRIDAYVTQEQAAELKIGDTARVSSPAFKKDMDAIVEQIDFVENSLTAPNRKLFHWSIPKKKSAKITLKFTGIKPKTLILGLPVTVSIKKDSVVDSFNSRFLSKDALAKKKLSESPKGINNELLGVAFADAVAAPVAASYCKNKYRLLPASFVFDLNKNIEGKNILGLAWDKTLFKKAKNLLNKKPNALKSLHSAGVTNAKDKSLKQTRVALRDANNAAILALVFKLSNDGRYLQAAKNNLLAWATTYQPNGHPIDETRLEGFLWAYDLLRCNFTWEEQKTINTWLLNLQQKKQQWKFGRSSSKNNFRTHQLKMLLMLDRLLDDKESLQADREILAIHAKNNLFPDGKSFDYKERDALHYHVYDLEPWLEIALLEPQYQALVNKVYDFLMTKIRADDIHNEFAKSKQKIDRKRAKGGFDYAKKGGSYDTKKITRSVVVHSHLNGLSLEDDEALNYLTKGKIKENIFYIARQKLWMP